MTPSERRAELAQLAYCTCEDKLKIEKTIRVDGGIFEMCLSDMPKHHRDIAKKRGFLRTYHKSFWTENPNGLGQTYHMGIVHIINEDAEVNQEYAINVNANSREDFEKFYRDFGEAINIKRHRLISIESDGANWMCATLTPQRQKFND